MNRGLSSVEAKRRLSELGPNELERERPTSPWVLFSGQFKGALIWLLVGCIRLFAALPTVMPPRGIMGEP